MITNSLSHQTRYVNTARRYHTVADIMEGACPTCGQPLDLVWRHLGGHGKVPHVCCSNPDGGETVGHVLVRIDEHLAYAYLDHLRDMALASSEYVRRLEAEIPKSRFQHLDDLVKTSCPLCGGSWEVIDVAGSYVARCVSPVCEGHGILHPISRRLAQAWEDLAQAEDMAYRMWEEMQEAQNAE